MKKQIFTRLLYNYDDVRYSLVLSLLSKKDYHETLFWATELFSSGFKDELWNLLMKYYLDFCNINQYKYYEKISEKYTEWKKSKKTNDFKPIMKILNVLFSLKTNDLIFKLMNMNVSTRTLYKLKDKKYKNAKQNQLNISLQKHNLINIGHYFNKLSKKDLYEVLKDNFNEEILNVESYYKNKKHILLSNVCKDILKKKITYEKRNIKNVDILFIKKYLKTNYNERPNKILSLYRLYGINEDIGCFELSRNENMRKDYLYNWEYYAYRCPLWKKRLSNCGIGVNDWYELDKDMYNVPKFKDEDMKDNFYEKFNLEPDEQSLLVHDKSIKNISKIGMYEVLCKCEMVMNDININEALNY